ncbi:MAG: HDOD domain-containing protein, partial [Bdellovibrionales bacterium]|nr:HDOD domain-containing protein [Bdellovibrionales bacterium]
MQRLLIVDPDPQSRSMHQQQLLEKDDRLSVSAAESIQDASGMLTTSEFDAVLIDLDVPNAGSLLRSLQAEAPRTLRLVTAASNSRATESLGLTHHVFSRPADPDELLHVLRQTHALSVFLASPELESLLRGAKQLPSIPRSYFQLTELLAAEDYHQQEFVSLVEQDPSLTALILRASNSAFFGGRSSVTSITQGVTVLGANVIRTMVLGAELFGQLPQSLADEFHVESLWLHANLVGRRASRIARYATSDSQRAQDALTAGIVHDIGKVVLMMIDPKGYREVADLVEFTETPTYSAENEVFGVSHQEVGAYLLGQWGI